MANWGQPWPTDQHPHLFPCTWREYEDAAAHCSPNYGQLWPTTTNYPPPTMANYGLLQPTMTNYGQLCQLWPTMVGYYDQLWPTMANYGRLHQLPPTMANYGLLQPTMPTMANYGLLQPTMTNYGQLCQLWPTMAGYYDQLWPTGANRGRLISIHTCFHAHGDNTKIQSLATAASYKNLLIACRSGAPFMYRASIVGMTARSSTHSRMWYRLQRSTGLSGKGPPTHPPSLPP